MKSTVQIFTVIVFLLCNVRDCHATDDLWKRIDSQTLEIKVLQQQVQLLLQKTKVNSEYCQLQPDDICGPCLCRDYDRLLSNYYCDCRNLEPRETA